MWPLEMSSWSVFMELPDPTESGQQTTLSEEFEGQYSLSTGNYRN